MLRRIILALLTIFPLASLADMTPTQQDFIKLYLASFLRAPDLGGLNYWSNQVATGALQQAVGGTIFSLPVVTDIYPSNLYDQEFVESIYRNVFGRNSDAEGLNYWVAKIAALRSSFAAEGSGNAAYMARGQLVMDMINAGLGTTDGADGKAYIVNRLEVARSATQQQLSRSLDIPPEKLLAIESCANADPSSVNKALQEITNFYNPAHTLGGTVAGLVSGQSLTLLYGCGNVQKITGNGAFTFAQGLAEGSGYAVAISIQPSGQACMLTNGTGTVANSNVTNVAVTCATPTPTPTPIDPELVKAVTDAPPSTQAEIDNFVAKNSTPEAIARTTRLRHNQDLIFSAVDPEPQWFSTHASSDMILGMPGVSYSVDLRKFDINRADLGAVDQSKLRLELRIQRDDTTFDYIPAEYQADYVQWDASVAGRLNIKLPADINRGRLVIGVRPNFKDAGQAAIAERWSVAILVDVWPLKPNVTTLNVADVYYPLNMDAASQSRQGSAFTPTQITDALAQKGEALQDELVKPLVVKGQNLIEGQLVSYMIPLATGGSYPYGGRVRKVINGSDGQQLVLLDMAVTDVYDVLLGNSDDNQLVEQGVAPEFVTYRSGAAIPVDGAEPAPLDHFGPDDRVNIQAAASPFFKVTCPTTSNVSLTMTPILTWDNAGVEVAAGANAAEFECELASTNQEVDIPFFGIFDKAVRFILGAGLTVEPAGSLKLKLSAVSPLTLKAYAGLSAKKGAYSGVNYADSGKGEGLDDTPYSSVAALTGSLGVKGKLKVADKNSVLGGVFGNIGLEAEANMYSELKITSANAASANMGVESKGELNIGAKLGIAPTTDIQNLLKKQFGIKIDAFKVGAVIDILKLVDKADYQLGQINDDGQGKASVAIKASGALNAFLFGTRGAGEGYASLKGSSVYNDKNMDISYDVKECEAGNIKTPFVGCAQGSLCAKTSGTAKLCGGTVSITPVMATAITGEVATTQGTVKLTGANTGNVDPLTVSISGFPLSPGVWWKKDLLPGESSSFTAAASCYEKGVTRGTITADAGTGGKDEQENVRVCKCKPEDEDCDRTWASPHLLTADGLAYDYVASGDYILQQVFDNQGQPVDGMQVQARFLPGYDVSWPQAAALQVGSDVVEVNAAPFDVNDGGNPVGVLLVKVNGQVFGPPHEWHDINGGGRVYSLPGGGMIYVDAFVGRGNGRTWDPRALTVLWPQGSFENYAVKLSTPYNEEGVAFNASKGMLEIQMIRPSSSADQERGMLGNNDGDPSNDFMRRNGQVLGKDTAMSWTALYGLFGGDWLVKPHECLFSDGCATQPDFPTTAAILTPDQRALGEVACAALTGYYKEACVHDVGLSGSVDLVKDYYANSEDLNAMAEKLVTPGVDLPVYRLSRGERAALPESTPQALAYTQGASVQHVSGQGKYLLAVRPPRGASAYFSPGQPGALQQSLTAAADLSTSVEVHCGQPDPEWAELGDAWAVTGALQLWMLDPLSGFAKAMVSEIPLSCFSSSASANNRITAGRTHSLALDDQGGLWAWGANGYGQLGDGTTTNRLTPVAVNLSALGSAKLQSVVAGDNHSLALDDQGRLWAWGYNEFGELGDGTTTTRLTPIAVDISALGGAKVLSVVADGQHSLALDEQGRLWAWGDNSAGQLGDGTFIPRLTPVAVNMSALGGVKVRSFEAGSDYSLALDDQGHLWAWGANGYGQLGDGTTTSRFTPVAVNLNAFGGIKVQSFEAGSDHSLALDDQGRLWAWGGNQYGQLGDGTALNRLFPVQVNLSALGGAKIQSVVAGLAYTLVLDEQGRLWAWGDNSYGQLGDGTTTRRYSFTPVDLSALGGAKVQFVVPDRSHSLALDDRGRLWAWGANWDGKLGDGSTVDRLIPVLIGNLNDKNSKVAFVTAPPSAIAVNAGGAVATSIAMLQVEPGVFGGGAIELRGEGWRFADGTTRYVPPAGTSEVGLNMSCDTAGVVSTRSFSIHDVATGEVLLSDQSTVTCLATIGVDKRVQGDGSLSLTLRNGGNSAASMSLSLAPGVSLAGGGNSWLGSLTWAGSQTISLQGGVACPGLGEPPIQLGTLEYRDATGEIYYQQPLTLTSEECRRNVLAAGDFHSLAVDDLGHFSAWGKDEDGQLGDALIGGIFNGLGTTNPVVSVAAGHNYSLALDTLGRLWSMGGNESGQIGNGTGGTGAYAPHLNVYTPYLIDPSKFGGAKVVSMAAGHSHSVALDDRGRLWAWGANDLGQLGDGTTIFRFTPVEVDIRALGAARVVSVAAGYQHSMAVDELGRLWVWGNSYGPMFVPYSYVPTAMDLSPLGGAKVVSVAGNVALDERGRAWAWGRNLYGQLGNGTDVDSESLVEVNLSALGGKKLVSVVSGIASGYTLALDEMGRLWAWGNLPWRESDETDPTAQTSVRYAPVAVDLRALNGAKVVAVAAGSAHVIALDDRGRLWALGYNGYGQLNDGTSTTRNTLTPVTVLNGEGDGFRASLITPPPNELIAYEGSYTKIETAKLQVDATRHTKHGEELEIEGDGWLFGQGFDGTKRYLVPSYTSYPELAVSCNFAGEVRTLPYRIKNVKTGEVLFSGQSTVTCRASIGVDLLTQTDGSLSVTLRNEGSSLASMSLSLAPGVSLGGGGSLRASLPGAGSQSINLIGAACPSAGGQAVQFGTLEYRDAADRIYYQKPLTLTAENCAVGADIRAIQSALAGVNLISQAAGYRYSVALDDQGRLWAWGNNDKGQLGDGTTINRPLPVAVNLSALGGAKVVSFAVGSHVLALDDQARVWAWGSNFGGQLGDGTTTDRSSPVAVTLSALGSAKVVSVKANSQSLAVDDQGRVWAWGNNQSGKLGDGTSDNRLTPVPVDLRALGGVKVVSVAASNNHSVALDAQGRLWSWGSNYMHYLGDGTYNDSLTPVLVNLSALGGAKAVSVVAGSEHSIALDDQGRIWSWGYNSQGQLGDGTQTIPDSPVAANLSALGGVRVVSVAAGDNHSLALDEQGRLWGWGDGSSNQLGALGYGSEIPAAVSLVPSISIKAVSVAAGSSHTLAIDDQGRLWILGQYKP